MPRVLVLPVPETAWVLPVEPSEFAPEFASSVGDAASERDGFDQAFAAAARGVADMRNFAPALDADITAAERERAGLIADLDTPLIRDYMALVTEGSTEIDKLVDYIAGTEPAIQSPPRPPNPTTAPGVAGGINPTACGGALRPVCPRNFPNIP